MSLFLIFSRCANNTKIDFDELEDNGDNSMMAYIDRYNHLNTLSVSFVTNDKLYRADPFISSRILREFNENHCIHSLRSNSVFKRNRFYFMIGHPAYDKPEALTLCSYG